MKFLIRISTPENGVVLDYFAGSGSTAQAVYETNIEDNASRHYVLVQMKEKMNKNTESFKKCIELNIKPVISEALLYRIECFLSNSQIKDEYIIERIDE